MQPSGWEQVTVDQRALIDKMLARCPGEFAGKCHSISLRSRWSAILIISFLILAFRELLQNSDDAGSSVVEIRFKSAPYRRHAEHQNTHTSTLLDLKSTHVRELAIAKLIGVLLCRRISLQGYTLDSEKQWEAIHTGRLGPTNEHRCVHRQFLIQLSAAYRYH